jgi:hypothetical protein
MFKKLRAILAVVLVSMFANTANADTNIHFEYNFKFDLIVKSDKAEASKVEDNTGMLVYDYKVDTSLVGMHAIRASGRIFSGNEQNLKVVEAMPKATRESGKIYFFQTGRDTPVGELAAEAKKRGLVLVDPHTLSSFNKANPEFADTHPNGTQWIDENGNVCYAIVSVWDGERHVDVDRREYDWPGDWWFAGFRE